MKDLIRALFGLPVHVGVVILTIYQKTLSPDHGFMRIFFPQGACCYYPSCSMYAVESLKKYGLVRSIPKIIWRIMRCHPFAKPRIDHP